MAGGSDDVDMGSSGSQEEGKTKTSINMGYQSGSKEETIKMGGMDQTTTGMGGKRIGIGRDAETTKGAYSVRSCAQKKIMDNSNIYVRTLIVLLNQFSLNLA